MFIKKVIDKNYFKSKCFYWIDVGWFRKKETMEKHKIEWPSPNKCYKDDRVIMTSVHNFNNTDKRGIINLNSIAHKKLEKNENVAAGMFGGKKDKLLKFIDLYYESIILFDKYNFFIGKDQNIFAFIAYKYPDIVKLVYHEGDYHYLTNYLKY